MADFDTTKNPYEDMLAMPYPFPTERQRMSLYDRAAQFGSFAALTGHEDAIAEQARFTNEWVEPDETRREELNQKLTLLNALLEEKGQTDTVSITYFKPDERKQGGFYIECKEQIKKIDLFEKCIIMQSNTRIPMGFIADIAD